MNPIEFFEHRVERWRVEGDLCVDFHAAMVESAINITQSEVGCVQLFLTDLTISRRTERANSTGLISGRYCDYGFNLYVLRHGKLGVNNYDEIKGHSLGSSVWRTHLEPLLGYFGDTEFLDFCKMWNYPIEVIRWQMSALISYMDNNYHGWKIHAGFRVRD